MIARLALFALSSLTSLHAGAQIVCAPVQAPASIAAPHCRLPTVVITRQGAYVNASPSPRSWLVERELKAGSARQAPSSGLRALDKPA